MAAAAASGLIYSAAFPPADLSLLVWLALVPLLVAAVRVPPVTAAGLGFVWGMAMVAGTAFWLPAMLVRYFDASASEAWLSSALIANGLVGSYLAVFAAWLSWLSRKRAVPAPLVGCGWAACEFARTHLLIANPWALSAYSQVDTPFAQTADLAGPFGLAFLIGTANGVLAGVVEPRLRSRHMKATLVGGLAVLVAAWAYGAWRLDRVQGSGDAVRVAIVQGAAVRPYRHDGSDSRAVLERHLELTEEVLAGEPDLVVWPEGAADFQPGAQTQRSLRLLRFSRKHGQEIILGGVRAGGSTESPSYYNSIFQIRGGRLVGVYDKLELMPFSETNPLRGVVSIGTDRYSPGPRLNLLKVGELSVGTLICSEVMLPAHGRRLAQAGATLFFNPSNDYWFGSESAARLQLTAARFRAIENRREVIRATSTGYSAFIDAAGRVVASSDFGGADLLTGRVGGSGIVTAYRRVGDAAAWLCVAFALLSSLLRRTWQE